MTYYTDPQLLDIAAAKGFKVDEYAHSYQRDHRAAMVIESFEVREGVLGAMLMFHCCFVPLTDLRVSTGHKRGPQFGEGFELVTNATQLAEVLHQAQVEEFHLKAGYTGAWVKAVGTEQAELWLTCEPQPSDPATVFCLYSNAPWPTDPPQCTPCVVKQPIRVER